MRRAQICSFLPAPCNMSSRNSLAKLGDSKPRHILVNRTALWDGPDFFTLQSLGSVVCPYRVQNRKSSSPAWKSRDTA